MINTMTKIGEGAFADVFGCQKEGWDKLAIKVRVGLHKPLSYSIVRDVFREGPQLCGCLVIIAFLISAIEAIGYYNLLQ